MSTKRRALRTQLAALLVTCVASTASAIPPDDPPPESFGDEIVVTATRTEKRLLDVPVPVRQVSRDAIDASAARTLADAIELTPGVRIESNCQTCNFSQVRLLGLEGPYTQILIDGQAMVSSLALVYGIEQFPARMLDSVEVVQGGGAAIYGAGAVGGVVNLIPHAPLDNHTTLEARRLDTGGEPGHSLSAVVDWSPAERQAGISILGQIDRVEPADRDGDGLTEVARRQLRTVALRGELYSEDDRSRWHAEANWTDARRRGGDLERIGLAPHETTVTEAIDTRRLGLAVGWLHTVSSQLDLRATASYADSDRESYYGAGFDPRAYGTTDNPLILLDSQVNVYRRRGTLTGGLQYSRDAIADHQPGYDRSLQETTTNLGLYVQDDRQLGDRVTAVYGFRADDHSSLNRPIVSPRLAILAAPRDDLTVRLSLARGFRAPAIFDEDLHIELAGGNARVVRPADDLVEERSTAWLSSIEWRPTFGRRGAASITLAAFRTDLDNLFETIEADDPRTTARDFRRVNAEGARVEGLEVTASARWGSKLVVEAGWVAQRARFDVPEPDFGSHDFFRTPERHATLSVQARLPAEIALFVGGRYTGPMVAPHYAGFIDRDRLEHTRAFTELDLNVSRRFRLGDRHLMTLTLGAKNLTDAYQEDLDRGPARDSSYVYGPRLPRTLHFGVRWEL